MAQSFHERVKQGLTAEERKLLKTAYDAVGDIAILEIDEGLRHKEKFIAKTLLACQKNLKTVLRKAGSHGGEFRTQKLKYLAGEKRTETIYRESGARLKLDVEKVYFSPRLGHERLRIAQQVKPGERILVMFSGCGPYPVVLAKNTKARQIIGIEINPVAHQYAVENIGLNKLTNVELLEGDVRTIIPAFFQRRVGLKSDISDAELKTRLRHRPQIMELHLREQDIDAPKSIAVAIEKLQRKNIEVILHAPFKYGGRGLNISSLDEKRVRDSLHIARVLSTLCRRYALKGFVIHPYSYYDTGQNTMQSLRKQLTKYMLVENLPYGFFATAQDMAEIAKKRTVCADLVHLFISSKNDEEFYRAVRILSEFNPYFHIADTTWRTFDEHAWSAASVAGEHHTKPIGEGDIDFWKIVPYVHDGIIEVLNKDEHHPIEMVSSYQRFKKIIDEFPHFDRILMPLPRGGEDFLDIALHCAKRGTTLHFYDFLHESEFKNAERKVAKACKKAGKKFKVQNLVKCGQFSPRTFRVCLDVKIR